MKLFTQSEGLNIQKINLACWKKILSKKAYQALATECDKRNKNLASNCTGYDVFRGRDLTNFVSKSNYSRRHR